jgi:predicted SPOUT superfamily RNA methylase MTH1
MIRLPFSDPVRNLHIPTTAVNIVDANQHVSVTVAERSKACAVFGCSEVGIVGSDPTQGMNVWCVCVYSVFVLSCV